MVDVVRSFNFVARDQPSTINQIEMCTCQFKKWILWIGAILWLLIGACSSADGTVEEPVRVAYCDLVANPAHYDGQVVRVKAKHVTGFEWSYLVDERCSIGAETWIIIPNDSWCEGAKPTNWPVPDEYDRSVSLERRVTLIAAFHDASGGQPGRYPFRMDLICLEQAGKWNVVRAE